MSANGASHNELDLLRDYHNNESRVYVTYVTVKWRHVRNRQAVLLCAKVSGGRLGPAPNVKFPENISQMVANRPGADIRLIGDLLV